MSKYNADGKDPAVLARDIRRILKNPEQYSISDLVKAHDIIEAMLNSGSIGPDSIGREDYLTLERFVDGVGPYEVQPGMWVVGPLSRKKHGDKWEYRIDSDIDVGQVVTVSIHMVVLQPYQIDFRDGLYWIYTNAPMNPKVKSMLRDHVIEQWLKFAHGG